MYMYIKNDLSRMAIYFFTVDSKVINVDKLHLQAVFRSLLKITGKSECPLVMMSNLNL